jgi:hypothetical protein
MSTNLSQALNDELKRLDAPLIKDSGFTLEGIDEFLNEAYRIVS